MLLLRTMPKTMPVLLDLQFPHCLCDVGLGHDCVSLENAAGSPAPDFHDDSLSDSGPPQIPGCGSPQIVKEQLWHSSSDTGGMNP